MTVNFANSIAVLKNPVRAGYRCGLAALVFLFGCESLQNVVAEGDTRTISFHHIHTNEDLTVTYKVNGRYDEAVLEFERDVLMGAGAAVVTALNGADVKTRLQSEQFDAIILNGKMPDQWGARESYSWIKQTYEVFVRLNQVLTTVLGMEASTRGFLLTGEDEMLRPYQAGVGTLDESLRDLRRLRGLNKKDNWYVVKMPFFW